MPHPRLPHAAKQLVQEIHAVKADAEIEPVPGSLDGLSVYRTIRIDSHTRKALEQTLNLVLESDERITGTHVLFGKLEVGFTPLKVSDSRSPFGVVSVASITGEPMDVDEPVVQTGDPETVDGVEWAVLDDGEPEELLPPDED